MEDVSANKIHQLVNLDVQFEEVMIALRKFNPLNVLGIAHHEYRHSNIIAWLLDPSENHNLQDTFFRKVILQTILSSENEQKSSNVTIEDITGNTFDDVQVLREEKNADIVVVSRRTKLLIIIENKLWSSEHSSQLQRYRAAFKDRFIDYKRLHIFLTVEGDLPSDDEYYVLTHYTILRTLQSVLKIREGLVPQQVEEFIRFYMQAIKELYMSDDDLVSLCRNVYAKYKKEIDYIYSVGNSVDIRIALDEFKTNYPEVNAYWSNQKYIWFNTLELQQGPRESDWGDGFPYSFWFENYYGNMKLILEIGPFTDGNVRVAFLERLEENDVQFRQSAKNPARMYTRIWTNTIEINDWQDRDEILEAMQKLYTDTTLRRAYEGLVKTIQAFRFE